MIILSVLVEENINNEISNIMKIQNNICNYFINYYKFMMIRLFN